MIPTSRTIRLWCPLRWTLYNFSKTKCMAVDTGVVNGLARQACHRARSFKYQGRRPAGKWSDQESGICYHYTDNKRRIFSVESLRRRHWIQDWLRQATIAWKKTLTAEPLSLSFTDLYCGPLGDPLLQTVSFDKVGPPQSVPNRCHFLGKLQTNLPHS